AQRIGDGLSNTAMLCEVLGQGDAGGWVEARGMALHAEVYFDWTPNSNHSDPWKANSLHPGGVHVAMGDGSVRFIGSSISLTVMRALATINGKEPNVGDF